jgi:Holliday junction resolvase RusA-like endonuclease
MSLASGTDIRPFKFEVKVQLEPMSGSKGKRKYARKEELVSAITEAYREELVQARDFFKGKKVSILIEFFLWKGDETHTDTTSKKDIDNLLKLVFDSLQTKVDSQHKLDGLGLIENDDVVYRIEAVKHIVNSHSDVGLHLELSEYLERIEPMTI